MTVVNEKVVLNFLEIRARLEQLELSEIDLVVGIATGGSVPASLVAYKLNRPLSLVQLNYRAEDNKYPATFEASATSALPTPGSSARAASRRRERLRPDTRRGAGTFAAL